MPGWLVHNPVSIFSQVAAQTGHSVTLVDISKEVLDKSQHRIGESIKRVAKKTFKVGE